MPGILSTVVGYAGGTAQSPTYHAIGDHAESIRLEFDPDVVAYDDLMERFWSSHAPTRRSRSRQYMSAAFYHDDAQQDVVEATKRTVEESSGLVHTEIAPAGPFYPAEDYHQKYMLRQLPDVWATLATWYGTTRAIVESTPAARLNGLAGGHGSLEDVTRELNAIGLPADDITRLVRVAGARCEF